MDTKTKRKPNPANDRQAPPKEESKLSQSKPAPQPIVWTEEPAKGDNRPKPRPDNRPRPEAETDQKNGEPAKGDNRPKPRPDNRPRHGVSNKRRFPEEKPPRATSQNGSNPYKKARCVSETAQETKTLEEQAAREKEIERRRIARRKRHDLQREETRRRRLIHEENMKKRQEIPTDRNKETREINTVPFPIINVSSGISDAQALWLYAPLMYSACITTIKLPVNCHPLTKQHCMAQSVKVPKLPI